MVYVLTFTFFLAAIGMAGAVVRRSVLGILVATQVIALAAVVNLIAAARFWQAQGVDESYQGRLFALFVAGVVVLDLVVGAAIGVAFRRRMGSDRTEEANTLRW